MADMTKRTPPPEHNDMIQGDAGPQRPPREGHRASADAYSYQSKKPDKE